MSLLSGGEKNQTVKVMQCVLRVFVRACTSGQPRAWQFSPAQPGFRPCSYSLRVRSTISVSREIIVALNSTEPRTPTLSLVLGL